MSFSDSLFPVFSLAFASLVTPANADLLAYYPFDTDFADASGNGNHLTVAEGEPTIIMSEGDFVFGSGALDTDITVSDREFLELTTPLLFEADDPWSIAFWARRRAGSDNRQGMVIGDVANPQDFVWLSDNPAQVQGLRFRSSDNANFNFEVGPDDAAWHHWVLVADGAGSLSVYRDNTLLGSDTSSTTFSVRNVAQAYNTNVHSMNGQIDELSIYDEALDEAAIVNLFNSPTPEELVITVITLPATGNEITVSWRSIPEESYQLKYSSDLADWSGEVSEAFIADEELTTLTFDLSELGLANAQQLFFRVEKL